MEERSYCLSFYKQLMLMSNIYTLIYRPQGFLIKSQCLLDSLLLHDHYHDLTFQLLQS